MLRDLIVALGKIVNQLIILAAGAGLLVFFWGLAKFIFKSGDTKSHEEGRNLMVWGIVALFVMVSVWGLVNFVRQSLGIDPGDLNGWDTSPLPGGSRNV
ncbi:pilin [Candidatus Parcubacteria bacterium]|nr:pilin [Candidatus Parcubacteria bacterium]